MTDKCPICNHELIPMKEGSSIGVRCSNCEYSIVTSYIDPIYEDENTYTLMLEAGNICDKTCMKIISRITGENFIQAKKLISSAPVVIAEGKAMDILTLKKELDENSIKYSISPKFPY